MLAVRSPWKSSEAVAPSSVYVVPTSMVTGLEPVSDITGAVVSDTVTSLDTSAVFPELSET